MVTTAVSSRVRIVRCPAYGCNCILMLSHALKYVLFVKDIAESPLGHELLPFSFCNVSPSMSE